MAVSRAGENHPSWLKFSILNFPFSIAEYLPHLVPVETGDIGRLHFGKRLFGENIRRRAGTGTAVDRRHGRSVAAELFGEFSLEFDDNRLRILQLAIVAELQRRLCR